jgi:hypothetical protein
VQQASVTLTAQRNDCLARRAITLIDGSAVLPNAPIRPDSLVVASDSSLGYTYLENRDYSVDYADGTVMRKPDGELAADQAITVWYRSEHRYISDADYQLDPERGRIRRLAGGKIAAGETMLLRYLPRYGAFPDDVIEQATSEANRLIEATIDPQKQFGADPMLSQAATCTALAIVCRAAATRDLAAGTGQDRNATVWLTLAEAYSRQSAQLLSTFRPPTPRPKTPQLT